MIWRTQLLYALHNASIWIPIDVFKNIFCTLILRKQVHHIRLEALQEAKESGGPAAPNPYYYYSAAQLQHIMGWLNLESSDPVRNIFITLLSNDNLMEYIEAGELRTFSQYPTLALIDRIWCGAHRWNLNNTSNIQTIPTTPVS